LYRFFLPIFYEGFGLRRRDAIKVPHWPMLNVVNRYVQFALELGLRLAAAAAIALGLVCKTIGALHHLGCILKQR